MTGIDLGFDVCLFLAGLGVLTLSAATGMVPLLIVGVSAMVLAVSLTVTGRVGDDDVGEWDH